VVADKQRQTIGYFYGEYHGASEWTAGSVTTELRARGRFPLDPVDDSGLFADGGRALAVGALGLDRHDDQQDAVRRHWR